MLGLLLFIATFLAGTPCEIYFTYFRLHDADDDNNGTLDFAEFLVMMEHKMNEVDHEAEMRSVFKVYDRDGNGTISADELKYMMTQLGEPLTDAEVDEFIRVADVDNDGQIDYEEFVKCMSIAPT